MAQPSLSLLIPAHDEAGRLATGRARLEATLEVLGPSSVEVILVDDGSNDETSAVAQRVYGDLEHLLVVRHDTNRGKGAALRLAMSLASADLVVTADADMAIDPHHFPAMRDALAHADLAPGDRSKGGRIVYDSRMRTLAGTVFNRLARHYSSTTLRDTQCGAKGFRRGAGRLVAMLGLIDGFAFDVEWLHLAALLGMSVAPVAVTWQDVRGSTVRVGDDSIQMWRDLRSIPHHRYELPAIALAGPVDLARVDELARATRLRGLVACEGPEDTLIALPRDGALGGLGIAEALGGQLRTANVAELRQRTYHAV